MKFILEPLNEGQSMNAQVQCKGTEATATARARLIAYKLALVLEGCSITCRITTESGKSFVVFPNGRIDCE